MIIICLASDFVGGGRNVTDEGRLVILKPVVHLSFTYVVLRDLVHNYLTFITSLL